MRTGPTAGIYFVSPSANPSLNLGVLEQAPISLDAVEAWLRRVPPLSLCRVVQPPVRDVADFLKWFWLPDESILYIGKATRLRTRVRQLLRHQLGMRRPHAGGHWLKTLSCLGQLHVYFAECPSVETAAANESAALGMFMDQVSGETKWALLNARPFANREHPRGTHKQNGISHDVLR